MRTAFAFAVLLAGLAAHPATASSTASSTASQERALDTGRTMQRVDALRAQADYDAAAAELRGWIERWNSGDVGLAEMERMRALLRQMLEMEELFARAPHDESAARAFLRHVVSHAEPTARTAEQAMALLLLARHDPAVMELLNATFPARLVITVDPSILPDPNLIAFPLESALVDVSRNALPLVRGPGASEVRVRVGMQVNDTSRSHVFAGTSMKSYAVHLSAEVIAPDGESMLRAATSTSVLGISAANAARSGMQRCAQAIYAQLVDDLAKRAALSS